MERRVRAEGVVVRLSKWMRELEQAFYGSSMSYDKALRGEVELADCLYRNAYMGTGDRRASHVLARYIRRELQSLDATDSAALLAGRVAFSREHASVVLPARPAREGQ